MMGKGTEEPNSSSPEEPLNTCRDPEEQSQWCKLGETNSPGSGRTTLGWKTFQKSRVLLPLCVFLGILSLILILILLLLLVLTGATVRPPSPQPQFSRVCPDLWPGFQGQCYYFSEAEANWTTSQESCRALGASLAILSTEAELNFTLRHKGGAPYWIGLEQRDNVWRWINGTAFDHRLVRGGGPCGYLNEEGISSSLCSTLKPWICSRPDSYVLWKEGLGDPKPRGFTPDPPSHEGASAQHSR